MMRWVSAVVRVMWHGSCGAVTLVVSEEKNSGSGSPCWISSCSQSIVAPSSRGGVPVLSRASANPGAVQALRERNRGRIAEAPGRRSLVAEMDHAAQEGAGRQHDCAAGDRAAVRELDAGDSAGVGRDPGRFAFDDGQVRGLADKRLHGAPIELAVGLGARPLDGRPLAAVEDAELDAGRIGGARHHAIERVDLAHEMALAQAADCGIAGHLADRRETVGDERGRRAGARRGGCGFASGMAPADDNDVKFHRGVRLFHVKHVKCHLSGEPIEEDLCSEASWPGLSRPSTCSSRAESKALLRMPRHRRRQSWNPH